MKKLLFYYPQHFNRSKNGTNPFFDRMLDICDREGIDYDILEEPDGGTDKPRNVKASKADAFFWIVTAIRKIMATLFPNQDFYKREKKVAAVINLISAGRYRYEKYITISGSMYHLFASLNPNATVYDMQHGVLFKHHPTFFDQTTLRLRKQYYPENLHFMFWGEGYRKCFVSGEEKVMSGKDHVVGYPVDNNLPALRRDHQSLKQIVVSLQFTHDVCKDELENMKQTLVRFLENTEHLGIKVMLKNHPRYNHSIEIDDIFVRFKHAELTNARLEELVPSTLLHVTYFSTTAFEYAQFGVPTFFLPYENKPLAETLFYDEYHYPLYLENSITEVVELLSNADYYAKTSATVRKWYEEFYSPFDEKAFLKLIRE